MNLKLPDCERKSRQSFVIIVTTAVSSPFICPHNLATKDGNKFSLYFASPLLGTSKQLINPFSRATLCACDATLVVYFQWSVSKSFALWSALVHHPMATYCFIHKYTNRANGQLKCQIHWYYLFVYTYVHSLIYSHEKLFRACLTKFKMSCQKQIQFRHRRKTEMAIFAFT